jgi:glycerol-3-phosphate dehydrogenase
MTTPSRPATLEALAGQRFDVLVIGGGITGAGVAHDAALRGLHVALVDKDDFAAGTSSRSSRLIHGGIRYLEHGHLHLVFEASAERRRLLRLAPHLVRPLQFVWPVYRGARVPRWKLGAGLVLYDALSLFRNVGRHRRLRAADVRHAEPLVRQEGLVGGAAYHDAATNDARLTLANALAARAAGAVVANHVAVERLLPEAGRITGAMVRDALTGRQFTVRARVVVNAAGPWTDDIAAMESASGHRPPAVRGSKGAHISVPRHRLRTTAAMTLLSPVDGRVMFVLPAGATTIIGTTETPTSATGDDVRASEADVTYLLATANWFFPGSALTRTDVLAAWAGIRPLVPSAASAGAASREHAITTTPHGVVQVTGGKLTTYRVMAEQVTDQVERALGRRPQPSPTRNAVLPGGAIASTAAEIAEAQRLMPADMATHLVQAHGDRWRDVWQCCGQVPGGRQRLSPALPYPAGELVWAVRHELACTLADLLVRRTFAAFELPEQGREVAVSAAALVAADLGWDDAAQTAAVQAYASAVQRIFGIDPNGMPPE